jgi:hypothetical protein
LKRERRKKIEKKSGWNIDTFTQQKFNSTSIRRTFNKQSNYIPTMVRKYFDNRCSA